MKILAIGLNPGVQRTLVFQKFQPGSVNRSESLTVTAAGKGVNFARATNILQPGAGIVAHFLGGDTGDFITQQLGTEKIPQLTVKTTAPTRTCTTLLCRATGEMTELIDPSPAITEAEADEMRKRLRAQLPDADAIALCGTFPPSVPPSLYAEIARSKGTALLLLDAYRNVEEVLSTGMVDILKINIDELKALTGRDDVANAAMHCIATYGLNWVALTNGPGVACLFSETKRHKFKPPPIDGLVNPIGAGDTTAAVMIIRMLEGCPAPEAFCWGLTAASASCRHLKGAVFDIAEMEENFSAVQQGASGTNQP